MAETPSGLFAVMHSAAVIATPAASCLMVISHPYKDPMEATVPDSNPGPGTCLNAQRGKRHVVALAFC
jgi:hypothetical protein